MKLKFSHTTQIDWSTPERAPELSHSHISQNARDQGTSRQARPRVGGKSFIRFDGPQIIHTPSLLEHRKKPSRGGGRAWRLVPRLGGHWRKLTQNSEQAFETKSVFSICETDISPEGVFATKNPRTSLAHNAPLRAAHNLPNALQVGRGPLPFLRSLI